MVTGLETRYVLVCQHSSCQATGASKILCEFQSAKLPPDIVILSTGCQGQCHLSPTVRILPEEVWYCRVQPNDVSLIVEQHLRGGNPVHSKLHPRFHPHG